MKHLVRKFSNLEQLALDPFAGALSVSRAGQMVENQRFFVAHEKDDQCLEKSTPRLLEVYVSWLVKQALNSSGDKFMTIGFFYVDADATIECEIAVVE